MATKLDVSGVCLFLEICMLLILSKYAKFLIMPYLIFFAIITNQFTLTI